MCRKIETSMGTRRRIIAIDGMVFLIILVAVGIALRRNVQTGTYPCQEIKNGRRVALDWQIFLRRPRYGSVIV